MSLASISDLSSALADLVATAAPHVVGVQSHRSVSSGFCWRDGLIVTADEALADEGDVTVTPPGGPTRPATVIGRDPTTDIALLRVEGAALPPIALQPGALRAGAFAAVVGAHQGGALAAVGVIACAGPAWRSMRGGAIDARIELDVQLRRQAEGGLVLDPAGGAIGMAVFGPRRRVLVIPAATIERVAPRLLAHGRVARGYLGLGLQRATIDGGGAGAMVMSVDPAGPGAAAGFRQGDVITALDGAPIGSVGAIVRALDPDSVGRTLVFDLRRGGEAMQLSLVVGERPAA